jgi:hypothetical protein
MVAVLDLKIARPAPQTGLAAVAVIQTAQAKTEPQAKVIKAEIRQQLLAVAVAVHLPLVQMQLAVITPETAATALLHQFLEVLLHTLAVAAVVVVVLLEAQVAPAAAVVAHTQVVIAQREQLTQVVVAVVVVIQAEFLTGVVRLAALVSLLSVMLILLMTQHQLQAHPHLPTLVDLKFIAGQVLVQLLSEVTHGTFCTT